MKGFLDTLRYRFVVLNFPIRAIALMRKFKQIALCVPYLSDSFSPLRGLIHRIYKEKPLLRGDKNEFYLCQQ